MKEFLLIFRNSHNPELQPSAEQMQEEFTDWMNWFGGIAAQNKLADRGNRLEMQGAKVVKSGNVVTDGPYSEIKEFIQGYIIVSADDIDGALELAKGCPILKSGGNVEVRTVQGHPADIG